MSSRRARPPGTLAALVFLAAAGTFIVSVTHGQRGLSIISAAIILTVTWETATRHRQLGQPQPRHPDRPWRQAE